MKNRKLYTAYLIILSGLCMISFSGCGVQNQTREQEPLQQNEELNEWEKLYDQ